MADTVTVKPNALPLPLAKKFSEQPLSNVLPLKLNRKLGTLEPVTPPPPVIIRKMSGAGLTLASSNGRALSVGSGIANRALAHAIGKTEQAYRQMGINVGNNYWSALQAFYPVSNDISARYGSYVLIANSFRFAWQNYVLLGNATDVKVSDTVGLVSVVINRNAKTALLDSSVYEPLQPVINLSNGVASLENGVFIGNGSQSQTQHAVPAPCRYYPIPETPIPPVAGACRIRPPSSRLPLSLNRKRNGLLSSTLPLPLMCWHDQSPAFIPNLESYIVHNTMTATIGGVAVELVDFNIKTDMQSAYWQGQISITPSQYAKVKAKIEVERGDEPLVIVTINGFNFAFIANRPTRNRSFANWTYSISGESLTARLGSDYAVTQGVNGTSVLSQDLYASQIVQQQLADTGFTIDRWEVADWLIPANTLSVADKSPIAVIDEIAKACGGFIYSDPSLPKLSILPRWQKPAWELATATPLLELPIDITLSISDKPRVNPRYNTVILIGDEGAEVYRNRQGRDRPAPIDTHPLYTDQACIVPKGTQVLSDSGTHADYSIKMRWTDKYNIPLGGLSEVWKINDEGGFNGIVNSVSVDVGWDGDAPTVWQTIGIDRYLDV